MNLALPNFKPKFLNHSTDCFSSRYPKNPYRTWKVGVSIQNFKVGCKVYRHCQKKCVKKMKNTCRKVSVSSQNFCIISVVRFQDWNFPLVWRLEIFSNNLSIAFISWTYYYSMGASYFFFLNDLLWFTKEQCGFFSFQGCTKVCWKACLLILLNQWVPQLKTW